MVRKFLEDLNFSTEIETPPNSDLSKRFSSFFSDLKMPGRCHEFIYKHQNSCVSFANCYPSGFSKDIKLFIAKYSVCILYIRYAPIGKIRNELESFFVKFSKPRYHSWDPILELLAGLLREGVYQHYGPIGTQAIIKSTLGFISGCIVEGLYSNELYVNGLNATTSSFPRWHRRRAGNSESFAHMLFPQRYFPESSFLRSYLPVITDLVDFIDMANDVLSFYKDVVVGAKTNVCIVNMARIARVNPVSILRETSESCVSTHRGLRETFLASSTLHENFDEFVTGYLLWHCMQAEYRLSEIGVITSGTGVMSSEPETTVPEPGVTVLGPEISVLEPEVAVSEPEVAIPEPGVSVIEPEVSVYEPEITATDPEVAALEAGISTQLRVDLSKLEIKD